MCRRERPAMCMQCKCRRGHACMFVHRAHILIEMDPSTAHACTSRRRSVVRPRSMAAQYLQTTTDPCISHRAGRHRTNSSRADHLHAEGEGDYCSTTLRRAMHMICISVFRYVPFRSWLGLGNPRVPFISTRSILPCIHRYGEHARTH